MKRLILLLTCLAATSAAAQNSYNALPDVVLDSVTVQGRRPGEGDVNVGSRVSTLSGAVLKGNQTKSLSELLSDNTTVYVKSLGQGAYATSSFRGTGPSHTQVNWNGININPAMSTSFDFSLIPSFFLDEVSLYHGGSYFKNGTGALGGTINLSNQPLWDDSTRVKAFFEYGSYDTYTGAASVRFRSERSLYRTRVYYQQSENDYRYLNKKLSKDPFYERRKDAQYQQSGVMQEAYFKSGRHGLVSTNLWVQHMNRRLPQPIIVNVLAHEQLQTTGLKYFLGYEYEKGKHAFSAKTAYLLDVFDYEQWADSDFHYPGSQNTSHSVHVTGDYRYAASKRLEIRGSLSYAYDYVNSRRDSIVYDNDRFDHIEVKRLRPHRNVLALQANVLWKPVGRLALNGQVMGELNDGRFAPTFAVGASLPLAGDKLTAKANVSYNYRFPSLNDMYWQPGGNPGLKPEKGFSYDATLSWRPRIGRSLYFKIDATYYAMDIDGWIMWLRREHWFMEPSNVHNVLSHGLELLAEANLVLRPDFHMKLSVNYSYSPSINREPNFSEDWTYGSQLPYVPLHKANGRLGIDYENLFFSYQVFYTGIRYTNDDETYSTNAYTIHDAEIGYNWRIGRRCMLTPKIRASNLFDAYYESTEHYPMPLRNILGSIMITF